MKLTIAKAWPLLIPGVYIRTNADGSMKGKNFKGVVLWKTNDEMMLQNGAGTRLVWSGNNKGTYIQIL